jgi:hypothetical protein
MARLMAGQSVEKGNLVFRKILTYGVVAGLIVGIPLSIIVITVHQQQTYGMVIGYTLMLVGLSTVFVAVKRHRDEELGGVIRFWPAFGMGLAISFVAGIVYVIAWETSVAIAHLDFAGGYAKMLIDQKKAAGVHGAELAKFVASMEAFKTSYANPFYRWPMTFAEIFPVGVLVSLFTAALLRNSRFLPLRRG